MSNRKMIDLVLYFRKTIEEKEEDLPRFFDQNYPYVLEDWCTENYNYFLDMDGYDNEEDAMNDITFPTTRYELQSYPEAYEEYKQFLVGIIEDFSHSNNPYNLRSDLLPLYVTFGYEGEVEDGWIIHFTGDNENINSILKDGYFLGLSNMDNLAISAGADEMYGRAEDGDGYCFGFHIDDVQENFKSGYGHYGDSGIIFKGDGIKLYHNGDDETQTIFIGNQVKNMIPFWFDSNKKEFYNKDNSIRMPFNDIDEFFERLTKETKVFESFPSDFEGFGVDPEEHEYRLGVKEVYHWTGYNSLDDILIEDRMVSYKYRYISFTVRKDFMFCSLPIRIVFDMDCLKRKFKVESFNYYKENIEREVRINQMEIHGIKECIKRVEIFETSLRDYDDDFIEYIEAEYPDIEFVKMGKWRSYEDSVQREVQTDGSIIKK